MRILTTLVAALCCVLCTTVLAAAGDPPPGSPPASEAKASRIDLNTASLDVLMALEGITPERAKAIVENRESRCYENAAELIDRKILPKAAYDRIKDKVKVGPCAQSDTPAAAADTGKRGK
jgi:DNA uptake protein ComE-like DNA-binding protein